MYWTSIQVCDNKWKLAVHTSFLDLFWQLWSTLGIPVTITEHFSIILLLQWMSTYNLYTKNCFHSLANSWCYFFLILYFEYFKVGLTMPIWINWINCFLLMSIHMQKKINFTPQPVFSWPNHFYLNRLDQFVAYWSLSTLKKNRFHTTTHFHNSLKNFQYLLMKTIWFSQINLSTSLLNRFRDIRLLKISKNAAIWLAKSILNDNSKIRHFPEVQYSHDHKEDYGSAL